MFGYQVSFASPWYLLLLLAAPLLWAWSYRSLAGLGRLRRALALILRTVVYALLVAALAEIQVVRTSDHLTVVFLLDQSLSVPEPWRRLTIDYYNAAVGQYLGEHEGDRAAAIVFGRNAEIEIPPYDAMIPIPSAIESRIDPEHTNLASALRLAQASFPHDAAKRIVLVSDFNENLGDALAEARRAVDAEIAIDLAPIRYAAGDDVAVDKVVLPADVRKGQPFNMRVVLNNSNDPSAPGGGAVSGKLRVERIQGGRRTLLAEQPVVVPPGKQVLTVQNEIDQPNFYTYEATFVPDDVRADVRSQNNQASAFTQVRGQGRVLLIEDGENPGEFERMIGALRDQNIEVDVRTTGQGDPFTGLNELLVYDAVLLAGVPREDFTDDQIKALVLNTQEMGAGLVMLGSPNSFGAGGWTNTELEKAMPVDFQIKNKTVAPVGALVLIMHASEMAQGNYWQKVTARLAIDALGQQDYCGLLHYDGTDKWLWNNPNGLVPVGANRRTMLARLDRMTPGDMPAFEPSLVKAHNAFLRLGKQAAVKHMIIISDGDPSPSTQKTLTALAGIGVKISTVAIGGHGPAGHQELQRIANATGGKYYRVNNASALPRIYQREARRVARPLIYEREQGFQPFVQFDHEMVQGVPPQLPPITGYVMTTLKEHPSVEVALRSPMPGEEKHSTVLAGWQFGLGKSVAFTTDAGARWANTWTEWADYDKLFSQIVRWAMRPVGEEGKFSVSTEIEDGRGKIIITALDKDDEFINFLNMNGRVLGPDYEPMPIDIRQTAPGRYVGEFDAGDPGVYLTNISPGDDSAPIRVGMNVPYSKEFTDRAANETLVSNMAQLKPLGVEPAALIAKEDAGAVSVEDLLQVNPFRHDLPPVRTSRDAWHWVLLAAACIFFFDVFVRRVQLDFAWVGKGYQAMVKRFRGGETDADQEDYMARLRSRKAAVSGELEQRRASARFEPESEEAVDSGVLREGAAAPQPERRAAPKPSAAPEAEQESYTERLLKAKKKIWDEKKRNER